MQFGEVVSKHLWISIVPVVVCAAPRLFSTPPSKALLPVSASAVACRNWGRSPLEILVLAIDLLLQICDPAIDLGLRLQKPLLDIVTNDRQVVYFAN